MELRLGEPLSTFKLPVEASKAREMALALGANEWRDQDPEVLPGREVVPTFTACSGHWQDRRRLMTGPLSLDLSRVLHGEQRWRYARPVRVGDLLDGVTTLHAVDEREGRRGGRMRLLTLRTEYSAAGEAVVSEDMVLVETQAPDRGPPVTATARVCQPPPVPPPGELPGPALADAERTEPISRTHIVRYAGASGDFTRVHHDEPYATSLGLPQVFTMGMLQGGMVGVHLARAVPEGSLRTFSIRFRDRLWPGESIVLRGWWDDPSSRTCSLEARADDGRLVLTGSAEVAR